MNETVFIGHARSAVAVRECPLDVDLASGRVECNGKSFYAPRRETLLLDALIRAYPRGVMRRALFNAVFDERDAVGDTALDAHVSKARKRMREAGFEFTISSHRHLGVVLERSP